MGQTKRIEWVDIVKYVCIIMVMLSHLETRTEIWSAFYSPFFLSAFFFTAGYVYKQKDDFVEFLHKKFRQLFVPWLIFSIFDLKPSLRKRTRDSATNVYQQLYLHGSFHLLVFCIHD